MKQYVKNQLQPKQFPIVYTHIDIYIKRVLRTGKNLKSENGALGIKIKAPINPWASWDTPILPYKSYREMRRCERHAGFQSV